MLQGYLDSTDVGSTPAAVPFVVIASKSQNPPRGFPSSIPCPTSGPVFEGYRSSSSCELRFGI